MRYSESTRESWDAPDTDVAAAEEHETAAASMRMRRGPSSWIAWALGAFALLLAVANFIAFDLGWEDFVFLGVILLFAVGLIIALNPRRGSAVGGTSTR